MRSRTHNRRRSAARARARARLRALSPLHPPPPQVHTYTHAHIHQSPPVPLFSATPHFLQQHCLALCFSFPSAFPPNSINTWLFPPLFVQHPHKRRTRTHRAAHNFCAALKLLPPPPQTTLGQHTRTSNCTCPHSLDSQGARTPLLLLSPRAPAALMMFSARRHHTDNTQHQKNTIARGGRQCEAALLKPPAARCQKKRADTTAAPQRLPTRFFSAGKGAFRALRHRHHTQTQTRRLLCALLLGPNFTRPPTDTFASLLFNGPSFSTLTPITNSTCFFSHRTQHHTLDDRGRTHTRTHTHAHDAVCHPCGDFTTRGAALPPGAPPCFLGVPPPTRAPTTAPTPPHRQHFFPEPQPICPKGV